MILLPSSEPPAATGSGAVARWAAGGDSRAIHERYHQFVRRIATRAMRTLPANVAMDDAVAAGWLGLLDALGRRTEQMTEEHFAAFASFRVRGAILDHLRLLDPLSRGMRRSSRQIARLEDRLTAEFGRAPEAEEIAQSLGCSLDEYQELRGELNTGVVTVGDLSELCEIESPDSLPEAIVAQRTLCVSVARAIESLPARLRLVLALYYQEDLGFREIGRVLGVTESRTCQLHSEAVSRIRTALETTPPPC